MKTWAELLALFEKQGYKGEATPEAVKAWLAKDDTPEFADSTGTIIDAKYIDTVHTKSLKKRVKLDETDGGDESTDRIEKLETEIKGLKAANARGTGASRIHGAADDNSGGSFEYRTERKAFEARAKRGDPDINIADADTAEVCGAYFRKMAMDRAGSSNYAQKKFDEDILKKANVSYDFASGGFAVPDVLRNTLISIRSRYSAVRQLTSIQPIDASGESVPRRASGATVYSPGEGVAATESNPSGDQVRLTPFEMVGLTTVTRTQLMRSVFDFGNFVSSELVYAIEKKFEEIFFLGDATSTYFNQTGIVGKYASLVGAVGTWSTNAEYGASLVRGAGNAWSELTYQNFMDMIARPRDIENPGSLKWACNRAFYYSTMLRIARSKGGVPTSEIINGVSVPMFEGFPVVFSNAMPATNANGQVCVYFGEFDSCTKVGNVATGVEMSTSTERYWEMSKVGYKVSMFKAVNAHDLGTANATTPTQTVPFAALVTAES